MSLDIGRRLRRGAGDGDLFAAAAAAVAARAAFSSSCLAYSSCSFFFFQYAIKIPPATAIRRMMTPTAIPILAPVERPELEDEEAWLAAVAEAAATAVLSLAVESWETAAVEVSKPVASALVANDSDEIVEKLEGEEILATEDVLDRAESADSTEDVAPEKLTMLEVASGSPTWVWGSVSLEAVLESTPIVVYPATEPEKVGEAVT
jgi:hypothetical protein